MNHHRAAILFFVSLTAGCVASADPESDAEDDRTAESVTPGYVSASVFNKTGLSHSVVGSGVPVTRTRGGRPVTTYDADHRPLGDVTLHQGPAGGDIRLQTLEELHIDGKTLFRVWAGGASNDGWIESDDVAVSGALHEETGARAGNGASCESKGVPFLTDTAGALVRYAVRPALIQTAGAGHLWKVYSHSNDAWFRFTGDWDKLGGTPDRVALMWSWTRTDLDGLYAHFSGGGVVRTEMRTGESFTPCMVMPAKMVLRETAEASGSTPAASARRLSIYAAYGRFETRSKPMYGWTILAERLEGTHSCRMHVTCAAGGSACPALPLPADCKM